VDPKLQAAVNAAVEKGVAHLLGRQRPDGEFLGPDKPGGASSADGFDVFRSYLGQTALALYTLRSCGVPAEDPHVRKGFDWLRAEYRKRKAQPKALDNYGVSVMLLALEAHAAPAPAAADADRYGKSARPARAVPAEDLAWIKELAAWLVSAQGPDGGFSYHVPGTAFHDHSNTQYSILALRAASRCGVAVPPQAFEKTLLHLLKTQERSGPEVARKEIGAAGGDGYSATTRTVAKDRARGWGYTDADPATGSMTAGGVSTLAICREELRGGRDSGGRDEARTAQAILDGLAWLGRNFTVETNPGPDNADNGPRRWQYYFLYGMERAGILAEAPRMGDHDWYREGAEYLVRKQFKGGMWSQSGFADETPEHMTECCFALLFLKRATARLVTSRAVATGSEGLDLSAAENLGDAGFHALFDRVFSRYASAGLDARATLAADFVRIGIRSIPLLIAHLGDNDVPTREIALEALRATTGQTNAFDPLASPEQRAEGVERWNGWFAARSSWLRADVAAGRFVERTR
jgi:hypothetical protein